MHREHHVAEHAPAGPPGVALELVVLRVRRRAPRNTRSNQPRSPMYSCSVSDTATSTRTSKICHENVPGLAGRALGLRIDRGPLVEYELANQPAPEVGVATARRADWRATIRAAIEQAQSRASPRNRSARPGPTRRASIARDVVREREPRRPTAASSRAPAAPARAASCRASCSFRLPSHSAARRNRRRVISLPSGDHRLEQAAATLCGRVIASRSSGQPCFCASSRSASSHFARRPRASRPSSRRAPRTRST